MKTTIKAVLINIVSVATLGGNSWALIDISLTPTSAWDVGAGGVVKRVNETPYVIQNNGEAVRLNIKGTDSENWKLMAAPGIDSFSIKWALSSNAADQDWHSIRAFEGLLAENIAASGSSSFYLRYESPRYISGTVGRQTSKIILSALSSFIGAWQEPGLLDDSGKVSALPNNIISDKSKRYSHFLLRDSDSNLLYAKWEQGGVFAYQVVAKGYGYNMALDSDGLPRVSYVNNNALHYTQNNGTAWSDSVLDTGDIGQSAIAVDSTNKVHIVYIANSEVKYIVQSGTGWSSPVSLGACEMTPTIAIGPGDTPYVMFKNQGLVYTKWNSSQNAWETPQVLKSGEDMGESPILRIGADGTPQVVFYDGHAGELWYAKLQNGAWDFNYIGQGNVPAFELDGNEYPVIVYRGDSTGTIYRRWVGTEWLTSPITATTVGGVGDVLGLNFNSQSKPMVFFVSDENSSLYHVDWQ